MDTPSGNCWAGRVDTLTPDDLWSTATIPRGSHCVTLAGFTGNTAVLPYALETVIESLG